MVFRVRVQDVSEFLYWGFEQRATHFWPAGSPTNGFEQDCQNTLISYVWRVGDRKASKSWNNENTTRNRMHIYQITRSKIIKLVTYEEMNVKSDAVYALILEYSTGGKGKRASKWLIAFESWLEAITWWLLIQILLDVILENYSFPLKLLYFFLAIDIVDRYKYQGP